MCIGILIFLMISKTTIAQINGEFWWLSDKVTKLKGVEAPQPTFEELTEFDTDESAKITFRDDGLVSTEDKFFVTKSVENNEEMESNHINAVNIVFPDEKFATTKLPRSNKTHAELLLSFINKETSTQKIIFDMKQNNEDIFIFKYPEDDNFVAEYPVNSKLKEKTDRHNVVNNSKIKPMARDDSIKLITTTEKSQNEINNHRADVLTFKFPDDKLLSKNISDSSKNVVAHQNNDSGYIIDTGIKRKYSFQNDTIFTDSSTKDSYFSENICTFMKKRECFRKKGIIYTEKASENTLSNIHRVCCIVPLVTSDPHRIVFPDSEAQTKRFRRSNKNDSSNRSLRQRDFLLEQRFRPQNSRPTVQTKIATPIDSDDDYYVDPYLNIKGTNVKKSRPHGSSKQDYNYPDYVEDYVVELPRPGLVGLYSDNGQKQPWAYSNENRPAYGAGVDDQSEEDEEPSFGYSTFDPRKGTSKAPKRGRPQKLTTSSPDEAPYDVESQTVSFQSTPNFQVLQGFKLLNLGRNKHKFYSKGTRRSTTEGSVENDSAGLEKAESFGGYQVYENCGKTRKLVEVEKNDKQFGDAESGSHPWMALVVLTRRPQGILCYATIVHPRAAVTAGDCVYGRTSPKEVILIAGLWNLSDKSRTQNRVVTVQLHPQYRTKVLAHDLALLHWRTPLQLNANIQPACLGGARDANDCKFFGWGGFDQAIRTRSRWQRASVITAQECGGRLDKAVLLPDDSYCATVQTRGTVTGIGGPLICTINGRKTSSGIAIWRDNALVLIPAQEWILKAFQDLNIQ